MTGAGSRKRYAVPVAAVLALLCALSSASSAPADPATSAVGEARVTIAGPDTVEINSCCVPPKVAYTFTFTWLGAIPPTQPNGPPGEVRPRMTVLLPNHLHSMETELQGAGAGDCVTELGPTNFWGPEWTRFSCTIFFQEGARTATVRTMIRPSGLEGTGTVTAGLDTGDRAELATTFIRISPPPPPPPAPPPAPIPGPPAAPTATVTEVFSVPGETEAAAVPVAPTARTAQIAVAWNDPDSAFDVTAVRIVSGGKVVARALSSAGRKPSRLRVRTTRTARTLNVRITGIRPGKLRFNIVARQLENPTRVVAKIRQSRKRVRL